MKRVIAIDWSGAKARARSKIWLAEVRDRRLTRLESGRNPSEVVAHLISDADADPDVVIGLDFAFSFPRWYAEQLGTTSIEELWNRVAEQGEEWLRSCPHPFWGKPRTRKPELREHFRLTEQHASKEKGAIPKSVFQIGGAGAVGTGSIRGMPHLATLRSEGFSIWPFHEVQTPLVIEIYPRLLTHQVNKSDFDARQKYLAERFPEIDNALACKAASSEDAFDAAVSALVMGRHVDEISSLTRSQDPTALIEGRIWWPREIRAAASSQRSAARQDGCPFCDLPRESVVARVAACPRHSGPVPRESWPHARDSQGSRGDSLRSGCRNPGGHLASRGQGEERAKVRVQSRRLQCRAQRRAGGRPDRATRARASDPPVRQGCGGSERRHPLDRARARRVLGQMNEPRTPAAEEQLAFLRSLQRLLDEGSFVSSYKFALLHAIADLCLVKGDDSGAELELSTSEIAEQFVRLYWPQVAPFVAGGHGQVLSQNTGRQAAIVRELAGRYDVCQGSLAELERKSRGVGQRAEPSRAGR